MENLLSVSSLLKNINIDETSQSRPLLCAIGFSFEGKYNKNITEDFQNLTQTSSGKALYGDCMHLVDFPKETTFVTSCLLSIGSKFFPFRVVLERRQKEVISPESVSALLNSYRLGLFLMKF